MNSAIPAHPSLQALESDKAPSSVGYRVKLLSQLLGRHFQEMLDPHGLTPFHWLVLCCLWEQDGLPTSHLGDRLCQVGGTLTGVIDRMEERGLVRRERDPEDRRVLRIWLTESGRQFETVLPLLSAELRERALKGLSPAERQLFSEWIDRIIANLS
jgi:MarR family transcriptional regulator, organic hydroperoxide resistance regulator